MSAVTGQHLSKRLEDFAAADDGGFEMPPVDCSR